MSQALTHFAVGATVTVLVVTYLIPDVPYPRVVSLLGGVWAMLPDVHWLAPVGRSTLKAFHRSPYADVFFFHHALDVRDRTDSNAVAAVALSALILATALADRREYRALERVRTALEDLGDSD